MPETQNEIIEVVKCLLRFKFDQAEDRRVQICDG